METVRIRMIGIGAAVQMQCVAKVCNHGIAANVLASHWQKVGKGALEPPTDFSYAGDAVERSIMLGQLVRSLSQDQRLVVVRRFVDQKSIREIAQELGRSEGAIKQLQLRALEKLREKVGKKL